MVMMMILFMIIMHDNHDFHDYTYGDDHDSTIYCLSEQGPEPEISDSINKVSNYIFNENLCEALLQKTHFVRYQLIAQNFFVQLQLIAQNLFCP